jgi:hypothetical protein
MIGHFDREILGQPIVSTEEMGAGATIVKNTNSLEVTASMPVIIERMHVHLLTADCLFSEVSGTLAE